MKDEITWEILQQESGYPHPIQEMTTVSKKVRRIGRFDWDLAQKAVQSNRPTKIAITGLDYLNCKDRNVEDYEELTGTSRDFLRKLQGDLNVPAWAWGTSPALTVKTNPFRLATECSTYASLGPLSAS